MGKLLITYKRGKTESLKCKSEKRAAQIVSNRNNIVFWKFYKDNERVVIPKKKVEKKVPTSLAELELMLKQQGLF
jgi:hypothetical protein